MKKLTITLICALLSTLSIALMSSSFNKKRLQHVVAFNYKPEITAQQQQKVKEAFYALQKEIPEIKAFEGGDDIHPEKKKFTQCFVVSVKNEQDLETYASHPKHKAFSAMVDPMLADVMVIDYWAE